MTEPRTYSDGPTTHRYRTFTRGTSFHVVTVDYADGDQQTFHVPSEVVNALGGDTGHPTAADSGADSRGRPERATERRVPGIDALREALQAVWDLGDRLDSNQTRWTALQVAERLGVEIDAHNRFSKPSEVE